MLGIWDEDMISGNSDLCGYIMPEWFKNGLPDIVHACMWERGNLWTPQCSMSSPLCARHLRELKKDRDQRCTTRVAFVSKPVSRYSCACARLATPSCLYFFLSCYSSSSPISRPSRTIRLSDYAKSHGVTGALSVDTSSSCSSSERHHPGRLSWPSNLIPLLSV